MRIQIFFNLELRLISLIPLTLWLLVACGSGGDDPVPDSEPESQAATPTRIADPAQTTETSQTSDTSQSADTSQTTIHAETEKPAVIQVQWGEYGPFDTLSDSAISNYSGQTAAADVNEVSASVAVNALLNRFSTKTKATTDSQFSDMKGPKFSDFFKAPFANIASGYSSQIYAFLDKHECESGFADSSIVRPESNSQKITIKTLNYDRCVVNGIEYSGSIAVAWETENYQISGADFVSFDEMTYKTADYSFTLTGESRMPMPEECQFRHLNVSCNH